MPKEKSGVTGTFQKHYICKLSQIFVQITEKKRWKILQFFQNRFQKEKKHSSQISISSQKKYKDIILY